MRGHRKDNIRPADKGGAFRPVRPGFRRERAGRGSRRRRSAGGPKRERRRPERRGGRGRGGGVRGLAGGASAAAVGAQAAAAEVPQPLQEVLAEVLVHAGLQRARAGAGGGGPAGLRRPAAGVQGLHDAVLQVRAGDLHPRVAARGLPPGGEVHALGAADAAACVRVRDRARRAGQRGGAAGRVHLQCRDGAGHGDAAGPGDPRGGRVQRLRALRGRALRRVRRRHADAALPAAAALRPGRGPRRERGAGPAHPGGGAQRLHRLPVPPAAVARPLPAPPARARGAPQRAAGRLLAPGRRRRARRVEEGGPGRRGPPALRGRPAGLLRVLPQRRVRPQLRAEDRRARERVAPGGPRRARGQADHQPRQRRARQAHLRQALARARLQAGRRHPLYARQRVGAALRGRLPAGRVPLPGAGAARRGGPLGRRDRRRRLHRGPEGVTPSVVGHAGGDLAPEALERALQAHDFLRAVLLELGDLGDGEALEPPALRLNEEEVDLVQEGIGVVDEVVDGLGAAKNVVRPIREGRYVAPDVCNEACTRYVRGAQAVACSGKGRDGERTYGEMLADVVAEHENTTAEPHKASFAAPTSCAAKTCLNGAHITHKPRKSCQPIANGLKHRQRFVDARNTRSQLWEYWRCARLLSGTLRPTVRICSQIVTDQDSAQCISIAAVRQLFQYQLIDPYFKFAQELHVPFQCPLPFRRPPTGYHPSCHIVQ